MLSGGRRLADGTPRRVATMKEFDGRGAGDIRARHATSGDLAAVVFSGGITPPRWLRRHGVGHQRAE